MRPFPQTEDMDVLASLVEELSEVLENNREATNKMCEISDELNLDNDELLNTEQQESGAQTPKPQNNTEFYHQENESLKRQIEAQKRKNVASSKLLSVCQLSLEDCLNNLRPFAHQRTVQTLEIHKQYIGEIEKAQNKFMELVHNRAQLENRVYELARNLGIVLRTGTDYSDVTKTADYLNSLKLVICNYNDNKI